jgi:hypothetical protein
MSRVVEVAEAIVHDLIHNGPASKTGISGRISGGPPPRVRYNAFPYFDEALHYARMHLLSATVSGPDKPIVYSHDTDQYGFPDDLVSAEAYILRWNLQYVATRVGTMMEQARLAQVQHGASADMMAFQAVGGAFQTAAQLLVDSFNKSSKTQRGAVSTGAKAVVYLEP